MKHAYANFQFKRVNPYQGLVIDPETWALAHDFHRLALSRHERFRHRPGIISGLEVTATDPPSKDVMISPGIGLDPDGNVVVLTEEQRYQLQLRNEGLIYLVIQHRSIPSDHLPSGREGEGQATRILEGLRIQERDSRPAEAFLELARLRFESGAGAVNDAPDFFRPGKAEIDLRSRIYAGGPAGSRIRIGYLVHSGDPAASHVEGLWRFMQQANRLSPYQFIFAGSMELTDRRLVDVDILYFTGSGAFQLPGEEVLPSFFRNRGRLWADPCHQSADDDALNEFRRSFSELVKRSQKSLNRLGWGHPALRAPFVFGRVPAGISGNNAVLVDEGFTYSDSDLGCSWLGGWENKPMERADIRSLIEFGVNLAVN